MTDREIARGMWVVSAVYSALAGLSGYAALFLVEGVTVVPAALTAVLFFVGSLMLAWSALTLLEKG